MWLTFTGCRLMYGGKGEGLLVVVASSVMELWLDGGLLGLMAHGLRFGLLPSPSSGSELARLGRLLAVGSNR